MREVVEVPRPLSCSTRDGIRFATFDREELLRFVGSSDAASFEVEDENGNRSVILIQPIVDFLSS
jgi:hypothetical protein